LCQREETDVTLLVSSIKNQRALLGLDHKYLLMLFLPNYAKD